MLNQGRYDPGLVNFLGQSNLPVSRAGGEISFHGVRRLPYQYQYNNSIMSLAGFLNAKWRSLNQMPDGAAKSAAFLDFERNYAREYIHKLPLAAGRGTASRMGTLNTILDIDAKEEFERQKALGGRKFNDWEYRKGWVTGQIGKGYGISATMEHMQDWMMTKGSIMPMEPGYGSQQEYIRKFTTLFNKVPLGTSQGMGIGVGPSGSRTPLGIMAAASQTKGMLHGYQGTAYNQTATALNRAIQSTSIIKMAKFSRSSMLAGGTFMARKGTFNGLYKYDLAERTFDPYALGQIAGEQTAGIMSKINGGFNTPLNRSDLQSIYAASVSNDLGYQKLAAEGLGPTEILKKMGIDVPSAARVIAPTSEGNAIRLQMGLPTGFGAGAKANIGDVKALISYAKPNLASKYLGDDVDILAPMFTKKEVGRQLKTYYKAAELWLTHNLCQGDRNIALNNAQRIATLANKYSAGGVRVLSTPNGPILHFPNEFAYSGKFVRSVTRMLGKKERGMMYAQEPTMPVEIFALMQRDLEASGNITKYGLADIQALRMAGQHSMADAVGMEIAKNPAAMEYRDLIGFLGGRERSFANAVQISPTLLRKTAAINISRGQITGSAATNPIFDIAMQANGNTRWMLPLGTSVSLDIGEGQMQEFTHFPIASMHARGMGTPLSGEQWASDLNYKLLDLVKATKSGVHPDIQVAAQKTLNAYAGLSGKEHLLVEQGFKTKLEGIRGTLAFINPEAMSAVAAQAGELGTAAEEGYALMNMKQLKQAFRQSVGPGVTEDYIRQQVSKGIFVPVNRPPGAPQGTAFARIGLMTGNIKKNLLQYGKSDVYLSPGMGTYIGGDLDQDMVSIISHWLGNPEMQKEFERGRLQLMPQYRQYAAEAMKASTETGGGLRYALNMARAGTGESLSKLETATLAAQKPALTGMAYNAAIATYGGAMSIGAEESAEYARFNPEYAGKLSKTLFRWSEKGIKAKRGETSLIDTAISDILYGGNASDRASKIASHMADIIKTPELFGEHANIPQVSADIVTAMERAGTARNVGSLEAGYAVQRLGKTRNIRELAAAYYTPTEFIPPGTAGASLANAGLIGPSKNTAAQAAAEAIGSTNKALAEEGLLAKGKRIGMEALGDYAEKLKQGKGWSGLLIGGAVLAGTALSLRRPGQIIVRSDTSKGAQQLPNGGYIKTDETETPVIIPRKSIKTRVISNQQYDIRVKLKNVQRQDRNKFVSLSNLISSRYNSKTNSNIHIDDDSDEQDYQKIFTDEYQKRMSQGSW